LIIIDSDIIIDILRQYAPAIEWLTHLGDEEIALPGFVVMELVQGYTNKADLRKVEAFIDNFAVFWPAPETCDDALEIFTRFALSHNLGLLDALIGQAAVALNPPIYPP